MQPDDPTRRDGADPRDPAPLTDAGASHGTADVGAAIDLGGSAPHARASFSDPLPISADVPGAGSPAWMEHPVDQGGFGTRGPDAGVPSEPPRQPDDGVAGRTRDPSAGAPPGAGA
jgi:hypothetical protein